MATTKKQQTTPETVTKADYILIEESSALKLEQLVKSHLNNGWKLAGGVSIVAVPSQIQVTLIYTQALTK